MLFSRHKTEQTVSAEGFHHGSQGVGSDYSLDEIAARFSQQKLIARLRIIDRIKRIEAQVATLESRSNDATRYWQYLQDKGERMPPEIVAPLLAFALAACAALGEVVLLGPVMDGFGIADPQAQYFTAGVLVFVASGLLDIWIRRVPDSSDAQTPRRSSFLSVILTVFFTLLVFGLLVSLGWWRAEEMIFAASVRQGAWGRFLAQNSTLTRVSVTLLTMGLPIFAAIAFRWSFDRLRYAREWRRARRGTRCLTSRLNTARKHLEAETEKLETRLALIEKRKREQENLYLQARELGRIIGARQVPFRHVALKIASLMLVIMMGWLLLDPFISLYILSVEARTLLCVIATLGLGGLYASAAIRSWSRPSPKKLYSQKSIIWRSDEAAQSNAQASADWVQQPDPEKPLAERTGEKSGNYPN